MAKPLTLGELLARTAQTAEASTIHKPLGKPGGPGLWHHKGMQLPAYIQSVAQHLRAAHGESRAIEMAVGIVKNWAHGHDGHGNHVHPDVQAAAAKAIAEWDALKAGASKVRRNMSEPAYDADGLDASWDGDLDDLPDLSGLDVADLEALDPSPGGEGVSRAMPKLGTGARYKALKSKLAAKGASDPGALAAYIGRKKFGKAKFASLASKARKGGGRVSRTLVRPYPLEDCRIMRSSEGQEYASGRVVEAYAAVFDQPIEVKDWQGHYKESIDGGAFDATLDRISRTGGFAKAVRVLYNHGRTMGGQEAPEFQRPIGKPLEIRPDGRGLLTRTQYNTSPLAEEILENIRDGSITAQSFEGPDIQSSPALRGPGDKYRARGGALPIVRRMMLGLLNYGPALYAAHPGAEFLGVVRMGTPDTFDVTATDGGFPEPEDEAPETEGALTGGTPEDVTSARYHQHALYVLRSREAREAKGITW